MPTLEEQECLLDSGSYSKSSYPEEMARSDIRNAALLSAEIVREYGPSLVPQYALLGSICHEEEAIATAELDRRIFLNTNIPFSAFICGLQGSGKSHTMSCILGK